MEIMCVSLRRLGKSIISINMENFTTKQVGDVLSCELQTQGLSLNTRRLNTLSLNFQACWARNLFTLFIFSEMLK